MKLKAGDLLNKRTLIIGGLKSGKTRLLAKVIKDLIKLIPKDEITVIDMAPNRIGKIGGKLIDYIDLSGIRYLSPERVYAPRTIGRNSEEVLRYAEENKKVIKTILDNFKHNPSKVLIVNDLTLYLHAGDLADLMECIKLAETFLGTAYYGDEFDDKGSGVNLREKRLTQR
ncbi:hypothetical protein DRN86_03170, partial [Candidatus Geothermarchaeota archaeon]